MKELFYRAFAPNDKVAFARQKQVEGSLRPFHGYLTQAVHTARERQNQYQLPWERVSTELTRVFLTPLQTRLKVRRPTGRWLLRGWPDGVEPDTGQLLMAVNRGTTIPVERFELRADGVVIWPHQSLEAEDRLFWCGQECRPEALPGEPPPTSIMDSEGRAFPVARCVETDREHWEFLIEGSPADGKLTADGVLLEAQRMGKFDGVRRLIDAEERVFELSSETLRVEELPASGPLRSDFGVEFRWHPEKKGRAGLWIQLNLPEEGMDADAFMDPRAVFCDSDVREIWTEPRHRAENIIRVQRVDRDRYQLKVDRLPPEGSPVYLPVDVRALELQRRALNQLATAPLPHFEGLIRLCEHPDRVRWPQAHPVGIREDAWRFLTDPSRSGTDQQRRFVSRALGSPDMALMEGPPGSGKTTAICELVRGLALLGKRVLLCANTHVAIDNVVERLLDNDDGAIHPLRLGHPDKVDSRVEAHTLDEQVKRLLEAWRDVPGLGNRGDPELRAMAERTVVAASNLTCSTVAGVINHPLVRDQAREDDRDWGGKRWAEPITAMPHFDVLVVDEASKTLIQEFMVPALLAKRWVVVGDVRQLPPFTDRSHIQANLDVLLEHGPNKQKRTLISAEHQRALLLLWRQGRRALYDYGYRWLIVEPAAVLDALERELGLRELELEAVRVTRERDDLSPWPVGVRKVSLDTLRAGKPEALLLAAAEWVLVEDGLLSEVEPWLPANLLLARDPHGFGTTVDESGPLLFRRQEWLARLPRRGELRCPLKERGRKVTTVGELERHEQRWLERHSWAGELTWRLTRIHELRRGRNQKGRQRLKDDVERLQPAGNEAVGDRIWEIHDIGLPSILEVVQEGVGRKRSSRESALTLGMRHGGATNLHAFEERFTSLSFQHRMHAEIAAFPRQVIYGESGALKDANTIAQRDEQVGWDFGAGRFASRAAWIAVAGQENGNTNPGEVRAMEQILDEFVTWAARRGPPPETTHRARRWEVACITFYLKQEGAIQQMLRSFTDQKTHSTRFQKGPVEITCGTVDRFQGKEADLVLLSMRNTNRVGFLDSLNRLNVAVTRARQQLVIIGKQDYFAGCGIEELERLAQRTPTLTIGGGVGRGPKRRGP